MKKVRANAWVVGLISVVATGAIWWLGLKALTGSTMFWLCLGTVIGLELVTTWMFSTAQGDPRLVARGTVFLMETVLMLCVSVLYVHVFPEEYESYAIILVALTAMCTIFSVWVRANFQNNSSRDASVQAAREQMWRCQNVVALIQCGANGQKHREQLELLAEDLRYSLCSAQCELDENIYSRLCMLAETVRTDSPEAQAQIADVRNLLRRRAQMVKQR